MALFWIALPAKVDDFLEFVCFAIGASDGGSECRERRVSDCVPEVNDTILTIDYILYVIYILNNSPRGLIFMWWGCYGLCLT